MVPIPRKCGAFLADGSGEHDLSVWSVLMNTHKPPPGYCPSLGPDGNIRHGTRKYRRRIVIQEVSEGRPSTGPSLQARLRGWIGSFFWSGTSKPLRAERIKDAPVKRAYKAPPPPARRPAQPIQWKAKFDLLILFLGKKRYTIFILPLLFLLPVVVFLVMRAIYKRFFRRLRKRYRTKIRVAFIGAIVLGCIVALGGLLATLYDIVFVV